MSSHTPAFWAQGIRELSQKDPIMKSLIKTYKGEILKSRGQAFETLARSIVGQQISVKAADSVWKKVVACLNSSLQPETVLDTSVTELRSCGLSERKVIYFKDLARHFHEKLVNPHTWAHKSDQEVSDELVQVKGIGVWTAEMFLIFHLLRPNVFPELDLGLQKALSKHYRVRYPLTQKNLQKYRKQFSPWASVATWFLWRSLDPIPVEY